MLLTHWYLKVKEEILKTKAVKSVCHSERIMEYSIVLWDDFFGVGYKAI